jgi:dipeptidyl-peptidase-4
MPVAVVIASGVGSQTAVAQDRLPSMPGYAQYQKMSRALPGAVKPGALAVTWTDGGRAFEYRWDEKTYRYDVGAGKAEVVPGNQPRSGGPGGGPPEGPGRRFPPGGGFEGRRPMGPPGVGRGRQAAVTTSPDKKLRAFYRDRNLWLSEAGRANGVPITTDGGEQNRIKYGTASWVYGEELGQRTAIWWSPDSKKVAYYRFDESAVTDYYLTLGQTGLQTRVDAEPYPKAGSPNPVVDLFVYDVATQRTAAVDVRDGKPFDNTVVGHYVYGVAWSADGKELLFNRTNRRQNVMEFVAADAETGACRVVVREEWPPSWVENSPPMQFLKDGRRFVWTSERTGWKNLYLYDLSGRLLATLTDHRFEVASVVRVDEDAGLLYYMARDGDNPLKLQLHRVGLDGKDDRRLTDPRFHHTVELAPDGCHFIDVAQSHDSPPVTRLMDAEGNLQAELAKSDITRFEELGLKRVELFQYKAADGVTDLYGLLHFPSDFDPARQYPLLVQVYAGPGFSGARETFATPNALTEYGFLVASLDSRSAGGRGKRALDAIAGKLGVVEVDDQAAGVRALWARPYVDKKRVGIYGQSYGGYAAILCLLRHPDVFAAACASSPVTDFRQYDSIYTERYMGLPQENEAGYDAGSAVKQAAKLQGRLMLYFGTADNNVHPANSLQLIQALQRAGKSFELQVGPDQGHSAVSQARMMEFFIENLVLKPGTPPASSSATISAAPPTRE